MEKSHGKEYQGAAAAGWLSPPDISGFSLLHEINYCRGQLTNVSK